MQYKDNISNWHNEAVFRVGRSKSTDFRQINTVCTDNKSTTPNNDYLEYSDIPKFVIDAFVSIEDRTFWKNKGYSIKGILRVVWKYLRTHGRVKNGASTITQQLARLIYLNNEISMKRKLKEIFYAIELTKKYSKQEIIEFYSNNCYFGNYIYGIESAAKVYFGISASKLSLAQVTYLCALPNNPTYYDPYINSKRALVRSDKILRAMKECDYISSEELTRALNENLKILPF